MSEKKNINEGGKEQGTGDKESLEPGLKNQKTGEVQEATGKEQPVIKAGAEAELIFTPQPLIEENMEIHKHPHHITHKKKWGEYLLEFLMLFLAVFLGFIAENIREHYIEHQRAKQYASSLINDLAADTLDLARASERYYYSAKNIDTFLTLLISTELKNTPTGKLYWYGLWSGFNRSFIRDDATFQQMKNSGSLRYLNDKTINRKMGEYDALVRKIERQNAEDLPLQIKTRELRSQIFDFKYNYVVNRFVLDSVDLKNYPVVDSFMKSNPPLMNNDKTLLNQFAEFCRVRTRIFTLLFGYQQKASQLAKELIADLKKEYDLE